MITVREINTVDDFNEFKDYEKETLHILKVGASWCQPCKMLTSTIKGLDSEKTLHSLLAEVDVDEVEEIADILNIRNVPVLVYYKNGEEVKRTVGLVMADEIYKTIEELSK